MDHSKIDIPRGKDASRLWRAALGIIVRGRSGRNGICGEVMLHVNMGTVLMKISASFGRASGILEAFGTLRLISIDGDGFDCLKCRAMLRSFL